MRLGLANAGADMRLHSATPAIILINECFQGAPPRRAPRHSWRSSASRPAC